MSTHNTDSSYFVNSSPKNFSKSSPPRNKTPNRYSKIKRYLGVCADLVFNKIAFFGKKNEAGWCIATQEFLAQETGYCVRTVQRAIGKLERANLIEVVNYKPTKRNGKDNKEETKWSVNHYRVLKEGDSLWWAERSGEPPITPSAQRLYPNEWFRRKRKDHCGSNEQPCPPLFPRDIPGNTRNERLLWEILNERDSVFEKTPILEIDEEKQVVKSESVGHKCRILNIRKEEEEKDNFFSRKQKLTDTDSRPFLDCQEEKKKMVVDGEKEGFSHDTKMDVQTDGNGGTSDFSRIYRENQETMVKVGERDHTRDSKTRERGTEDTSSCHSANSRKFTTGGNNGAIIDLDTVKKITTRDLIHREVIEWTSRDPNTYGTLANFVYQCERDKIDASVILRVIRTVCESGMRYWRNWANKLIKEYGTEAEQLRIKVEKNRLKIEENRKIYEELEREKQNRTGKIDLISMMKSFRKQEERMSHAMH